MWPETETDDSETDQISMFYLNIFFKPLFAIYTQLDEVQIQTQMMRLPAKNKTKYFGRKLFVSCDMDTATCTEMLYSKSIKLY